MNALSVRTVGKEEGKAPLWEERNYSHRFCHFVVERGVHPAIFPIDFSLPLRLHDRMQASKQGLMEKNGKSGIIFMPPLILTLRVSELLSLQNCAGECILSCKSFPRPFRLWTARAWCASDVGKWSRNTVKPLHNSDFSYRAGIVG